MKLDLYQGSTGEKRSRDLFVFVRVAIAFAMLAFLCAGLSECRAEDAAVCRTPECGHLMGTLYHHPGNGCGATPCPPVVQQPTAQELRDAAMLRELRAMRRDVRRLESLLKAERNSGHQ